MAGVSNKMTQAITARPVNFLIAGAQKSGTTTLHAYLKQHSEIGMATKKEVHFFNQEHLFKKGGDYSFYHSFFDFSLEQKMRGEVTPAYMYSRDAPRRIWEYNPKMKIIIILRNPIDRAYSHWNMEKNRGAEELSFREALEQEESRSRLVLPSQDYRHSYIDRGYYVSQIREMWRLFSRKQVLVLNYDALCNDYVQVLVAIYDFLGVSNNRDSYQYNGDKVLHKGCYAEEIKEVDKLFLKNIYACEIKQIENLLGWNCSSWLRF